MLEPLVMRKQQRQILLQRPADKCDGCRDCVDDDGGKGARFVARYLDRSLDIRYPPELELARSRLDPLSNEDVSTVRADDNCAVGAQSDVLPSAENQLVLPTLTAVKLFLSAQINCGLTVT